MNVSVVGLGKLGAPLAAVLADKRHTVIGVDLDDRAVRLVNEGRAPVFEPGLTELFAQVKTRLSATGDFAAAVDATDVTFVVVPTPSDERGAFSLRYVLAAAASIGKALRDKAAFHLVVLTSTVMPGATAGEVLPVLEAHSGKRCGHDFGLCYNPEFIALGSVIRDMRNPDMILIGESDARSGDLLAGIYRDLCPSNPPVARMSFINAELAKLAVNTFVTTKISFANMLARLCERLPGADVDLVTSALGLDSRIGRKYLKGALGYGGPCFPRDNVALAHFSRQLGVRAVLAEATDQFNRQQIAELADIALSRLPAGGRVGILGLSYKPNTNVIDESPGMALARHLVAQGVPVLLYDPAAMENARRALGEAIVFAASAAECASQVDVVVITTPWDEFRGLTASDLKCSGGRPTVLDCWRILDRQRFEPVADYLALGTGPSPSAHVPLFSSGLS